MKTIYSLRVVIAFLLSVIALESVSAPGDVVRISNNATTLIYGNNYSYTFPSGINHISADGRFVAFYSQATNLNSADTNSLLDVFVYDRDNNDVELVSRKSSIDGGANSNGNSQYPSISADGRYVAFESIATNLDGADTSGFSDIYVYDRDSQAVSLVSRKSASVGGAKGNSFSLKPSINADGRYVAFSSASTNLDSADTDGGYDIYVYDRDNNVLELVSRRSASAGGTADNGPSFDPSISADGRYVAFWSQASNLDSADTDVISDIYVYDRDTDTLELVSRKSATSGGAKGNFSSDFPSISADGRYVAFQSSSTNLDTADTNTGSDVYVYDRDTDTLELVSRKSASAGGAKGNSASMRPSISGDGRYAAFVSVSTNLDSADTDGMPDIYVYDRQTQTQHLMSKTAGGVKSNSSSDYPAINLDGTMLAFSSFATNLDGPQLYQQAFLKETGLISSGANQPPIAHAGSDQTVEATSSTGASVTLNGSGSSDPNAGDSIVSYIWNGHFGTASGVSPKVTLPLGTHVVTLTVKDGSGATNDDTVEITVVDTTPPTLNCPASVSGIVRQAVDLGNPTVSDIVDSSPPVSNNAPTSYGIGSSQVIWTATDASGNSASCTQIVNLTYNFQGFFQPVDNQPVVNTVKGGATVPLKWRLSDYNGNLITDTTAVVESKYTPSTCGGTEDAIEETLPAGGTQLRWDDAGQQFVYNWKTPSLPGKCVRLDIKFNDSVTQSANFKLK